MTDSIIILIGIIAVEGITIWVLVEILRTQTDNNKYWSRQYNDMKERYYEILDRVFK